jgi:hypothetical protein
MTNLTLLMVRWKDMSLSERCGGAFNIASTELYYYYYVRSVGIVRSRTQATEFSLVLLLYYYYYY